MHVTQFSDVTSQCHKALAISPVLIISFQMLVVSFLSFRKRKKNQKEKSRSFLTSKNRENLKHLACTQCGIQVLYYDIMPVSVMATGVVHLCVAFHIIITVPPTYLNCATTAASLIKTNTFVSILVPGSNFTYKIFW